MAMAGPRLETEAGNGGVAAAKSGRLRRVFFGTSLALAAVLGACGAAPTPAASTEPAVAAAIVQPAALHRPLPTPFAGLSAADVVGLFGEPDFRRTEPPAELWQYRSADCVLDLFLYRDPSGVRVVHSETRDRDQLQAGHCRTGAGFTRRESRL
jgi:hypothetical protein